MRRFSSYPRPPPLSVVPSSGASVASSSYSTNHNHNSNHAADNRSVATAPPVSYVSSEGGGSVDWRNRTKQKQQQQQQQPQHHSRPPVGPSSSAYNSNHGGSSSSVVVKPSYQQQQQQQQQPPPQKQQQPPPQPQAYEPTAQQQQQLQQPNEHSTMVWVKLPPPKKKRTLSRSSSSFRSSANSSSSSIVYGEQDLAATGGAEAFTQDGRVPWAWKRGFILSQEPDAITVQLLPAEEQYSNDDNRTESLLTFPASALGESILLTNDFDTDEEGNILPPDDLITLTHLNEPAVLESLWARYYQDKIYTNTGSVLLALNPFQNVRGLYGETAMKNHWQRAERGGQSSPPHVYGIADAAFRSMRRQLELNRGNHSPRNNNNNSHSSDSDASSTPGAHQSILVSGESGAGKTVTTKFVMKYLAALSQRSSQQKTVQPTERAYFKAAAKAHGAADPSSPVDSLGGDANLASLTLLSGSSSIEGQVLQSNPILESFGNARTVRNDNSSRFGKFIEIQFSEMGQLVGASIETYLLEKVRLVHQSAGERNYHIFYELLGGGMDARQLSHYFIASTAHPEDFKLTASGTYDRRDGVTDRETYKALRHACAAMKFTNHELHSVFCVTAALLHASNLTLLESAYEESCCLDTNNVHLTPVCHLLGVTPEDLERALCQQTIVIRHDESVTRTLNLEKAVKCLEALLKAIYGALFEYLVHRINDIVAYRHPDDDEEEEEGGQPRYDHNYPVASVRVLDIFGFESFYVNSFEQLCINYCNETLQQQFNAFVLKNEQAEYDREGIEWSFIAFEENQDVLDLIDKRGQGILSLLDDQCRAPGPSDKAFLSQVYKTCKGHQRFSVSRQQEADNQFAIQHYAGRVEYTTYGFVEKNRDELSKEGTELVKNSQNPFVQLLAEIMEDSAFEPPPPPTSTPNKPVALRRADSTVGRPTVGGQFRRQLKHLRTKIDETTPHYIRCLKPNDMLVPEHFDVSVVAEQLRCGGILEAVRVARAGFTQHYLHSDFVRRYRSLAWKEMAKSETVASSSSNTTNFLPTAARRQAPLSPARSKGLFDEGGDAKVQCKELIRILYRRIEKYVAEEESNDSEEWNEDGMSSSPCKARSYAYASTAPRPSWSKTPSPKSPAPSPRETPRWKAGASDFAKVGIQLGKTKVFLRHKAFEVLERIRSRAQSKAATLLNSIFRMYLARIAYIPYRDAFRRELTQKRKVRDNPFADEYKETKEEYEAEYDYQNRPQNFDDNASSVLRFRNALRAPLICNGGPSLVDKWEESQIRNTIHNFVPRHEWGKTAPSNHGSFKWVLSDGLWTRNFDV